MKTAHLVEQPFNYADISAKIVASMYTENQTAAAFFLAALLS